MEFKAGQKVKIISSRSDDIDGISDMIGGVFVIEGVNSFNYSINGWYFDPDEIEAFEAFEAFEEVQETKPSMFQWKPIEECPKECLVMFVVKSFNKGYTSDPYCVWHSGGKFQRWPHPFPPTHFCELPDFI